MAKKVLTCCQGKMSSKRMPESAKSVYSGATNGGHMLGSKSTGKFKTFTPRIEGMQSGPKSFGNIGK